MTLTLLLFLFIGCAKDEEATSEKSTSAEHPALAGVEQAVSDALAELEADYSNPAMDYGEIGARSTVYVPAGSQNALAAAIASAGPNGKVILESGNHWESGTVVITQKVTLEGADGAKLYVDVAAPGSAFPFPTVNVLDPAILIKDCNLVWIKNLDIRPQSAKGSTGIFLEKGRLARIEDCTVKGFQFGIWASDNSSSVRLYDNEVTGYDELGVWGIAIESGTSAKLKGNYVAGFASNVFISDERGIMEDNEMAGGFQGLLLCTVQGNIQLPNGSLLENAVPCKDWKIIKNLAHDNVWNYLAVDGANNNFLFRNEAYNPGLYDVELAGPSARFGNPMPTSYDNFVVNPNNEILTKVCGIGNVALAGNKVNTAVDPCN